MGESEGSSRLFLHEVLGPGHFRAARIVILGPLAVADAINNRPSKLPSKEQFLVDGGRTALMVGAGLYTVFVGLPAGVVVGVAEAVLWEAPRALQAGRRSRRSNVIKWQ